MALKVKGKNEDGVMITKEIDDGLYSFYINMGWEVVKDEPKKNDIFKNTKKQDKEIEENNGEDL